MSPTIRSFRCICYKINVSLVEFSYEEKNFFSLFPMTPVELVPIVASYLSRLFS